MQITIESTEKLTTIEGVPCRLWKGTTAAGIECHVFVHRIAVHNAADSQQFDKQLKEQLPPVEVFPLRAILC